MSEHIDDLLADQAENTGAQPGTSDRRTSFTADQERAPEGTRSPSAAPSYASTCLADVMPEQVRWLWPGRLPAGKLVTLDGPPGVGKSTLTADVAARITQGAPLPGETSPAVPPSPVVLLSAEDGLADTIRPRLDTAGADSSLVHHLDSVPLRDEEGRQLSTRPPVIPDDLDALEDLVTTTGAVLVVIDVLMAYLSGRTNAHRDQDVRAALARLSAVADRTGACIMVLRHLRKAGGDAITAGGGSIGIIGAARAGLVVATDPDDETESRRVLAVAKSNLAAKPPALAYSLVTVESGCARVDWQGETGHTADQLVAPRDHAGERSERDEAVEWLRGVLADGPMPYRELEAMARDDGIARSTLHRARDRLEMSIERDHNARGRPSTWRLVSSQPPEERNPWDETETPSDQGERGSGDGFVPESGSRDETPSCTVCGIETRPGVTVHPLCADEELDQ